MSEFLSDQLDYASALFLLANTNGGNLTMSAHHVSDLVELFNQMATQAKEMENDISRLKWNAGEFGKQAEIDEQSHIDAVINEASRPGTNLQFLVTPRPDRMHNTQPPTGGAA